MSSSSSAKRRSMKKNRETMSLSSSATKRNMEARFDELPDSLLIHILSFLGVRKAGITSVLSKRWKYLWSELPSLEFLKGEVYYYWDTEDERNLVSWVNRTIDIRKGKYLEKFLVDMKYNKSFCSDVDAWVEFSVKSKVKELILILWPPMDDYYTPPEVMYSCSSLTNLYLRLCNMPYEGTIAWQSLTKLTLVDVILSQHLLDEILSGCPILNSLELRKCGGFNRLEVNSRCLNSVTIGECEREPSFLEISAPYVCVLKIAVFPHRRKWQLRNISSVVTASVDFLDTDSFSFTEAAMMDNAEEFIENFKHVNDLHLPWGCFKILSNMTVDGWQLPQFKLRHLQINAFSDYCLGISGIFNLLDSSPNLETLLIDGFETEGETFMLYGDGKVDLDGDLLHLKKVRVNNFADSKGEPLLTLARILLRRAPVLEEMVMVIDVLCRSNFTKISGALLTFPRSSPKAEIHLSHASDHGGLPSSCQVCDICQLLECGA